MIEQAKNCEHTMLFGKQWMKSLLYCGCTVLAVCVGGTASASDKSSGIFSRFFSPEICIGKIDWFEVGLSDGRLGIEPGYFSVYEQLCKRWSKRPDKKAYFKAYHEGIRSYCTPENIYQLARTGAVAISACEDSYVLRKAVQDGFANLLKQ
ncbi:DUF2799 domain-containing protein [Ruegeria lacuscaerulensis]|uniref:DUF2799 domain-containing protein n=1 Tax=Ruegeria lacuscaerulensis TaxID=55218 RepID=UPI00147E7039|nr:DUF2799 domain-containing protein [Ruegeria lacuscaerulensis]